MHKLYEVSYWTEGPGRSHGEQVLVLAKDKKTALKFVAKNCCVYRADRPDMTAKLFKFKGSMFLKYLTLEE